MNPTPVPRLPAYPARAPHPTIPQEDWHLVRLGRRGGWCVGTCPDLRPSRAVENEAWMGRGWALPGHSDPTGTHLERHSSLRAWMAMRVMFTDITQKGNCWNGGGKVSGSRLCLMRCFCRMWLAGAAAAVTALLSTLHTKILNGNLRPGI